MGVFHSFWRMVKRGLPEASIMTKLEGGGGGGEERERESGIKMIFFKNKNSMNQLDSDKIRSFR